MQYINLSLNFTRYYSRDEKPPLCKANRRDGPWNICVWKCFHKAISAEQAELVCSTLGNCQDDYEKWKCFSNGYPIHCWQCLNSDFTSRIVRTQQIYKHYNGEIDSRDVPAQIHHSLKRMTIISLILVLVTSKEVRKRKR